MREDVGGGGAVVLAGGGTCVGTGGVNVGADVEVAVNVGGASTTGVKDGTGVSP